ncbi:MAG: NAD(P)/FAD-dependent oxidoreductase [Myxococcota bacterium]|nr:NAD(P)/FAD-dependent oxidoreductase [Myxococcota bacterium]
MNLPVVVIGGGHNGLIASAYLARGQRRVILLEPHSSLGGLGRSDEFHPGYSSAGFLEDQGSFRPWIAKTLNLAAHGLRFAQHGPTVTLHSADRGPMYLTGGGVTGAVQASTQAQYATLRAQIDRFRPAIMKVLDAPPVEPLGPLLSLLGPALKIRALGAQDLTELIRVPPMCAADWMRDVLDDEMLGSALVQQGLAGTWSGPWSPWSAANVLLSMVGQHTPVVGGAPALMAALVKMIHATKVEVRTDAAVSRIHVVDDGIKSVTLASGETIETDTVCATTDPKTTGLNLIGRRFLSADFGQQLSRIRTRGTTAFLDLALDGPVLDVEGQPIEALRTCRSLDDTEKAFDPVKYREMSTQPLVSMRVFSAGGSIQCPDGHRVARVMIHYAPYDLNGGWTEQKRQVLLERTFNELRSASPAISDRIVGHRLTTPADLAERFQLSGGHIFQGEHAPDQLLFMRPTIDSSRYATPVRGLFFGGGGAHPGGGLSGAPGALCAQAMR